MIYRNLPIESFQTVKATAPCRGTLPSSDFKRRFSVFLLWSTLVTKIFQASHRKKSYNSRQIVCGSVTIICRGKKKARPTRWFAFNAKKRNALCEITLVCSDTSSKLFAPWKSRKSFENIRLSYHSADIVRFGGLSAKIDENVLHCYIVALHLFDMNKKATCLRNT